MVGGDVPWSAHASAGSFGHTGAGGCVAFADVHNEVTSLVVFGWLMRTLGCSCGQRLVV
jgi:hypothetical protein